MTEIPSYEQTRIVKIIEIGQTKRLNCSCKHYNCHQRTCHHVRAMFSLPLSVHDFGLINTKMHYALYGKLPSFTHCVDNQTFEWMGPILQEGDTPCIVRCSKDKDWFMSALPGNTQIHPKCTLMSGVEDTIDFSFETIHNGTVHSSLEQSPQRTLFSEEWQRSCQETLPMFACCNDMVVDESLHSLFMKGMKSLTEQLTLHHSKKTEDKGTCVSLPAIDKNWMTKEKHH